MTQEPSFQFFLALPGISSCASRRTQVALRHFACKENRVERRQEPLSLPLQMPVMLLNGELKAALLILSSRSRSHLRPPVTGEATSCANWLASWVPAAHKVTKSPHMSQVSQAVSKYEKHSRYKRGLVYRCYNNFQCIGSTKTICMPRCTLPNVHPCRENTILCSISDPLIITVLRR